MGMGLELQRSFPGQGPDGGWKMKNRQAVGGCQPREKRERPLVSVIIPVYNVAPYLREALDSVVNQTCRRLEIIVVDDGSTDGSGALCDEYASDPRVRVIHQENRGLSGARNAGLDRATGDAIAFLDSDDAFHPDFVRQMLEAMEGADVAVCRYERHDPAPDGKGRPAPAAKAGTYGRAEALRACVDGSINPAVWNKLYRRALWECIRFPEGHNHEDLHVICEIFDRCDRARVLDRALYRYRVRPGSICQTRTGRNCEDHIRGYEHMAAFVAAHIPEVFGDAHLREIQRQQMTLILRYYSSGLIGAGAARAACEGVDAADLGFRGGAACRMLRACPRLLRAVYPAHRAFRRLAAGLSEGVGHG